MKNARHPWINDWHLIYWVSVEESTTGGRSRRHLLVTTGCCSLCVRFSVLYVWESAFQRHLDLPRIWWKTTRLALTMRAHVLPIKSVTWLIIIGRLYFLHGVMYFRCFSVEFFFFHHYYITLILNCKQFNNLYVSFKIFRIIPHQDYCSNIIFWR